MRRLIRMFQQWRESWADAAYDDVRAEVRRLQVVQMAQQAAIVRLETELRKKAS